MVEESRAADSFVQLFGRRLTRLREAAGYSQSALGRELHGLGNTRLNQLERATGHPPTLANAIELDAKLNGDGLLTELWGYVNRETFPNWSRRFMDLEATCLEMRMYVVQVVPGLLQTEDYARAVLRKGRSLRDEAQLEERVAARMGRQTRLHDADAPHLWVVLDEAVLLRPVGGRSVMEEQLRHLLAIAQDPKITIQALPFSEGEHEGMGGSLTVLTTDEKTEVAYTEGADFGRLVEDPAEVSDYAVTYDRQRAHALPPNMSLNMIRTVLEGTDRVRVPTSQVLRLAKVQSQQRGRRAVRGGRVPPR